MAKAVNLIGTLKGKVGNVVYATVKGETIARVYQPTVANPRTARQELSRAKMTTAVRLARGLMMTIREGFSGVVSGREFQQAIKAAIPLANGVMTGTVPDQLTINYESLGAMISAQQLIMVPEIASVDYDTAGMVKVVVNLPESANRSESTGEMVPTSLFAVVYQPDTNKSFLAVANVPATFNNPFPIDVLVPSSYSGLPVHVYAFIKQTPAAVNGIGSTTVPLRVPGKTSQCVYGGTGDLA